MSEHDTEPTQQLFPRDFKHYEVLDQGRSGGMATVYKVYNRQLDVVRALKVLKPELARDPEALACFKDEARFGARLSGGPHILQIHTVDSFQHWNYFEMEWVEGSNLADYCKATGPLPPWAALAIAWMVLEALDHAHNLPGRPANDDGGWLMHRDVKPANVLLDFKRGTVWLADFGIAKVRDAATTVRATPTAGTLNYMSPEHVRGEHLDARADIYQVGLVLYESLSGQRAYPGGDHTTGIPGRILDGNVEPLRKVGRGLDPEVIAIVERAMETDKRRRYQTAKEMQAAVANYLLRRYDRHSITGAFKEYLKSGKTPKRLTDPELLKRRRKMARRVFSIVGIVVLLAAIGYGICEFTDLCKPAPPACFAELEQAYQQWIRLNPPSQLKGPIDEARSRIASLTDVDSIGAAEQICLATKDKIAGYLSEFDGYMAARRQLEAEYAAWMKLEIMNLMDQVDSVRQRVDFLADQHRWNDAVALSDSLTGELTEDIAAVLGEFRTQYVHDSTALHSLYDNACLQAQPEVSDSLSRMYTHRQNYERTRDYRAGTRHFDAMVAQMRQRIREVCRSPVIDTSTKLPDGCSRSIVDLVGTARRELELLRSQPGWPLRASRSIPSIDALSQYLSDAQSDLSRRRCEPARDEASAVLTGVRENYVRWASDLLDSAANCPRPDMDRINSIRESLPRSPRYEPLAAAKSALEGALSSVEFACGGTSPPPDSSVSAFDSVVSGYEARDYDKVLRWASEVRRDDAQQYARHCFYVLSAYYFKSQFVQKYIEAFDCALNYKNLSTETLRFYVGMLRAYRSTGQPAEFYRFYREHVDKVMLFTTDPDAYDFEAQKIEYDYFRWKNEVSWRTANERCLQAQSIARSANALLENRIPKSMDDPQTKRIISRITDIKFDVLDFIQGQC